jgi:drug/metabolite transporter (DMT)-like permease
MFFGDWLIYSTLALVCWGGVNVLDSFFVEEEVYENASEGMIVSSLFKILGTILVGGFFYQGIFDVGYSNIIFAMSGGALLSSAFWFYFKSAFVYNDLSLVQIFLNMTIPIVTILGIVFLGEELSLNSYIGIGIVFLGAMSIYFSENIPKVKLRTVLLLNIPLVILYSLSELVVRYVEEIKMADFWLIFPWICMGQFLFGLVLLFFNRKAVLKNKLFQRVASGNLKLFVFSEMLELLGLFFMMLAIARTTSVAFYTVAESFMPIVVVVMTGVSGYLMFVFKKGDSLQNIYKNNHLNGFWLKAFATTVMALGIYVIG